MQGFSPKYYDPFPPHSPEDLSQEEVINEENYYESGGASTPLIHNPEEPSFQEGFVPPANPSLTNPLSPPLVQINSSGEFETDYHRLPLVEFEDIVNMES